MLVGERPLAQAVKAFEHTDPITLPFISPESRSVGKTFLKRAAIG